MALTACGGGSDANPPLASKPLAEACAANASTALPHGAKVTRTELRKADANVIGAVLNDCEVESSEYYYAYYNKDGKRMKHGDSSPVAAQDTFDMDSSIVVPQNPRGSRL